MQPKYPRALLESLAKARKQGPVDVIVYNKNAKFVPTDFGKVEHKFVPAKFGAP